MKIHINGVEHELAERCSVADIAEKHIPSARWTAIVLDGAVVPRGTWADTIVSDGARLEILTPRQGG
jgi:sulfur carrier protein